ncbi:MAG: ACP S-malonyltransferase [Actinomycetota bacterium]
MLAVLSPGQGSQTPGMLQPWLDDPALADLLGEFSEAARLDLRALGTTADAETIRDTAVAQPLIVAASLLAYSALAVRPGVAAGHSVGELAALAVAGVLEPRDAVALASTRGRAMADDAATTPTGMSAVVGGVREDVLAAIEQAGAVAANVNSATQVVAAGTPEQLERLSELAPARSRVIPLQVAGAFHTPHMARAQEVVRAAAGELLPQDPAVPLLSNRDGEAATSGQDALDRIVSQMTSPVRWDLCSDRLATDGVTGIVELNPGGVLTGLAKRELRGVPAIALNSPVDLEAARAVAEGSNA